MKPSIMQETFELEIQIEELEPKVAPDGGETVLPLPLPKVDRKSTRLNSSHSRASRMPSSA